MIDFIGLLITSEYREAVNVEKLYRVDNDTDMKNIELSELSTEEMTVTNGGGLITACVITGLLLLLAQKAR